MVAFGQVAMIVKSVDALIHPGMIPLICRQHCIKPIMADFMVNGKIKFPGGPCWGYQSNRWIFHATAKTFRPLYGADNVIRILFQCGGMKSYGLLTVWHTIFPYFFF